MAEIIQVEQVSKQYRLGQVGTGSFSHDLNRWWHLIRGKEDPYLKVGESNDRSSKGSSDYVWALEDINFSVKQGEVLGLIGRNGAGKSTLLKILSRTTTPTTGRIRMKGRVASLLEVGTGFHPELSGRDNIFLNGAILGMTKAEIKRKFDEIVAFAGVERYVDTPVKRYSSGMYVRLAFGVAAHLEPEILIVDEVLAVGDAEFQKKALGKMKDVSANEGRTVLFVSHNMAAVKQLCTRGIVMQQGKVVFDGTEVAAVNFYQNSYNTNSMYAHEGPIELAAGNENIRVLRFEVLPETGDVISISSGIRFRLEFFNFKGQINLDATFELRTPDDLAILQCGKILTTQKDSQVGIYEVTGRIAPHILNAGTYKFTLIFGENQRYPLFVAFDFVQFEILNETKGSNAEVLPGFLCLDVPFQANFRKP